MAGKRHLRPDRDPRPLVGGLAEEVQKLGQIFFRMAVFDRQVCQRGVQFGHFDFLSWIGKGSRKVQ
jgi:hypothetical protein